MRNPNSTDSISGGRTVIIEKEVIPELHQPQSEVGAVVRVTAIGLAGFAVLYLLFLAVGMAFPYIRPGDNLVADMKHRMARSGNAFQSARGSRLHVMAFGYSKTLAGFIPTVFDSQMGTAGIAVESYNFGLPGDSLFVADLEAMAAHGTAPDIALLTFPWPPEIAKGPSFFHFINDDQKVMDDLFPFRHFPRDLAIMAIEGGGLGGIRRVYAESERSVRQVSVDRGYYFIARQSHYKNDELPADFKMPYDAPASVDPRPVTLGPVYEQLAAVLSAHHIDCIFVPKYYRAGEFGPAASINQTTATILAGQPNLSVQGPDYWLYPNRYFSDPVHANPRGATAYTRDLAGLLTAWLKQHPDKTR